MIRHLLLTSLLYFAAPLSAQENLYDSLRKEASRAMDDKSRFKAATSLFGYFVWSYPDSALLYAQQNIRLARKLKSDSFLIEALGQYKILLGITGNYAEELRYSFNILEFAKRTKNVMQIALALKSLGDSYRNQGDYKHAVQYGNKVKAIYDRQFSSALLPIHKNDTLKRYINLLVDLAKSCEKEGLLDSAFAFTRFAERAAIVQYGTMDWAAIPFVYGNIYLTKGDFRRAIQNYHWGLNLAAHIGWNYDIMDNGYGLAQTYEKTNQIDSAIFYSDLVLKASTSAHYPLVSINAMMLLAKSYKAKGEIDSSTKYFELTLAAKDSFFSQDKVVQMQNLSFNEQLRQQELQEKQIKQRFWWRIYALLAGLGIFMIIALLQYRNNRNKQKAKVKIEKAYEELKATQAQLIQREKMASLGELTAGIAHEIQNPLNFVNNFSDTNAELLTEMQQELDTGNIEEAKQIASDVIANEEKINLHGKRAEAIVKNMLQHSRTSSAQKELVDVNKLVDEYVRLSYHGYRAKDKNFNAKLDLHLDESVGKVNIIPQEIGRVLLNLFNNAFYAVYEHLKKLGNGYEPTVTVTTKKQGDNVEITVQDNGMGISKSLQDKIFQPFFTTKPTGQGTGLGLSLSYDIIKAYGGELKVESTEGSGTAFIIRLPLQ